MTEQTSMANLGKVDHVVVLMLENRSFDHMLGYLSLEGGRGDVDGLREDFANEHGGRNYPVHHLDSTVIEDDPESLRQRRRPPDRGRQNERIRHELRRDALAQ